MLTVNVSEAKAQLSRLIDAIESLQESQIIITRNGRPVARLLPLNSTIDTSRRIGVAKNAFVIPDDIDVNNEKVAALVLGSKL
jgi:prevent-host-death family protein